MIKILVKIYIRFREIICKCFCSCKKSNDELSRDNSVVELDMKEK